MKVCTFYRNVCEELYDKSEDEFYESLIDKFELAITEYEKEKEVLINVSSDYEICCVNNNPYFENEEVCSLHKNSHSYSYQQGDFSYPNLRYSYLYLLLSPSFSFPSIDHR